MVWILWDLVVFVEVVMVFGVLVWFLCRFLFFVNGDDGRKVNVGVVLSSWGMFKGEIKGKWWGLFVVVRFYDLYL